MADKTDALERLKSAGSGLLQAAGEKALSTAGDKVKGLTSHLEDVADGGPLMKAVTKGGEAKASGDSPVMGAIKGLGSGVKDKITGGGSSGGGGGGKESKSVNILETIDVGVPIDVAYNAWTEFGEFPSFMRKVEQAEAKEEAKIEWKAQIFLSHRTWEATILDQIPNERIVWRSKGEKGHVDGAVTFHEVTPTLTRIMVVLEYYPQGFFEKTGNLWRAQGRRARSDLRHFKRHVMTRSILEADEIEGWRGVIEDGEVVKTHDEVVEEEEAQAEEEEQGADDEYEEPEEGEESEDSEDDAEPEDEYDEPEEGEPEDEYDDSEEPEGEPEDEYEEPEEDVEEDEPEDEYEEPEEDVEEDVEEDEPEDEYEDDYEDEEDEPRRRRRAS
jgi:uncharacterized membrane protein